MATSDFHGDFDSLAQMLDDILCHLNSGGIFITHGDNISEIQQEKVHEDKSLKVLVTLLLLMKEYPTQCFYSLGNHELYEGQQWTKGCTIERDIEQISKENQKQKETLLNLIKSILQNLPEIVLSKATRTVYVHASLPVLKEGETILSDMLKHENIEEDGLTHSTHTLESCRLNIALFENYQTLFGMEKFIKGHEHRNGYGYHDLEHRWQISTQSTIVTTYASSEVPRYWVEQHHQETEIPPYTPQYVINKEGQVPQFYDILTPKKAFEKAKNALHNNLYAQNIIGETNRLFAKTQNAEEIRTLTEVLRRTHAILFERENENLPQDWKTPEGYKAFAQKEIRNIRGWKYLGNLMITLGKILSIIIIGIPLKRYGEKFWHEQNVKEYLRNNMIILANNITPSPA